MKRHPALRDLSDDHHTGLVLAARCRRSGRPGSEGVPAALWSEVRAAFAGQLEPHFEIEERLLLPALDELGEGAMATRIREDHASLRAMRDTEIPTESEVVRFGELLESHIRFEERQVFEGTQDRLPDHVLAAIAEASRKARSPGAETLEQRVARVVAEHVEVVPYDPKWKERFQRERDHLLACLPGDLVRRIEHFGSTAVPGLAAKPIIDILVEVADLEETRLRIAPILEAQGYDYFWRPSWGDDQPPFYAWFIKRDERGARSHHIHMVEAHFEHWDRLLFRDYLVEHPDVARAYAELKTSLAARPGQDRIRYTEAKTGFVRDVTARAKAYYGRRDAGTDPV